MRLQTCVLTTKSLQEENEIADMCTNNKGLQEENEIADMCTNNKRRMRSSGGE